MDSVDSALAPNIYILEGEREPRQFSQTRWGSQPPAHGMPVVYLDYVRGDDANAGTTPSAPLRTRDAALQLWRRLM